MKNKKWLPAILLIIGILVTGAGCTGKKKDSEAFRVSIQVMEPEFKDYTETLVFNGETETPQETNVSFLVSGRIEKLYCEVGDPVEKGAVMGILDQAPYIAAVRAARGQAAGANASHKRTVIGARQEEREISKAQMLQAKANWENSKADFKRYENVYKEDALSKQQYDAMKTQHELALQQYNAAKKQHEMVNVGATKEELKMSESNMEMAAGNLQSAELQLSYTTLRAPISGVVSRKMAEVGTSVGPSMPVYEIRTSYASEFEIYVPSIHINRLTVGDIGRVSFIDEPGKEFRAKIKEIQPVSDKMVNSFKVKLAFIDKPGRLAFTGTIGKAAFNMGPAVKGAFIPISALMAEPGGDRYYIYYVDGGNKARKIDVKASRFQDEQAMITADLPEGARVVISGQEYLAEGMRCRIVTSLNAQKFVTPDREKEPRKPGVGL